MTRARKRISVDGFISEKETLARGMTDVGVGSGALLGLFSSPKEPLDSEHQQKHEQEYHYRTDDLAQCD
jgi:hypothetical protein